MIDNKMTCGECDELFLDYFEDTLDVSTLSRFNEHTSTCLRCQTLIRDVNGIRGQAAVLPDFPPSRDLWSGIEERIQPEIRSIATRSGGTISKRWLATAAAALVVATSGVTYLATARSIIKPVVVTTPKIALPPQVGTAPELATSAPNGEPSAAAVAPRVGAAPRTRIPLIVAGVSPKMSLASSAPPTAPELAFSGEIDQLQSVLVERRAQLDPETLKVVEDNL
ncbi:MAG: hypothetical protein ABIQ55_00900, partial [Gemmatimonadaceae bacterium]